MQGLELSQIALTLTSPLPMVMTVETVPQSSSSERRLLHVLAVDPAVCSSLIDSVCRTFSNVTLSSSVRYPKPISNSCTACNYFWFHMKLCLWVWLHLPYKGLSLSCTHTHTLTFDFCWFTVFCGYMIWTWFHTHTFVNNAVCAVVLYCIVDIVMLYVSAKWLVHCCFFTGGDNYLTVACLPREIRWHVRRFF